MFGFSTHFLHEVLMTKRGTIILIDIADTFDAGIEGAYAIFDEDTFRSNWEDSNYTFEDIREWGEELNAFSDWEIVSSHHRSVDAATKKLFATIKNL